MLQEVRNSRFFVWHPPSTARRGGVPLFVSLLMLVIFALPVAAAETPEPESPAKQEQKDASSKFLRVRESDDGKPLSMDTAKRTPD
jgi:hypothetical protein